MEYVTDFPDEADEELREKLVKAFQRRAMTGVRDKLIQYRQSNFVSKLLKTYQEHKKKTDRILIFDQIRVAWPILSKKYNSWHGGLPGKEKR